MERCRREPREKMQMTVWESRGGVRMGRRKRLFCSNQNDPLRYRGCKSAIWGVFILHFYPDWQVIVGRIFSADTLRTLIFHLNFHFTGTLSVVLLPNRGWSLRSISSAFLSVPYQFSEIKISREFCVLVTHLKCLSPSHTQIFPWWLLRATDEAGFHGGYVRINKVARLSPPLPMSPLILTAAHTSRPLGFLSPTPLEHKRSACHPIIVGAERRKKQGLWILDSPVQHWDLFLS